METIENTVSEVQDLFSKFLEITDNKFIRNGMEEDDRFYQYYRTKLIDLINNIDVNNMVDNIVENKLDGAMQQECRDCEKSDNNCDDCIHDYEES